MNAESEEARNFRLSKLQEAFFRDLQAVKKPIMIIFDTFNSAPASVADWVGGGFLVEVADVENVRVVIAGQIVPKPSFEWSDLAETHCLEKIDDIEAWYSFTQAKKLPFEREAVKAFVRSFQGNPDAIVKIFESQAGGWKND